MPVLRTEDGHWGERVIYLRIPISLKEKVKPMKMIPTQTGAAQIPVDSFESIELTKNGVGTPEVAGQW